MKSRIHQKHATLWLAHGEQWRQSA